MELADISVLETDALERKSSNLFEKTKYSYDEIGRHTELKLLWAKARMGSTPIRSTNFFADLAEW